MKKLEKFKHPHLPLHLVVRQVVTLVHAVAVGGRANVVWHQVVLLQLVV